MITRAKNGVAREIMSNVLMMAMKQESQLRKDMGMVSSIVKMSWNIQKSSGEAVSDPREREKPKGPMHTGFLHTRVVTQCQTPAKILDDAELVLGSQPHLGPQLLAWEQLI